MTAPRGLAHRLSILAGVAITVALAVAALRSQRAHRRAAERVLRDFAGIAASELARRAAFDIGFNGYQIVAAALNRTAAAGVPALPARLPPPARALVAHLFLVEGGRARQLDGGAPPAGLETWVLAEAAALPDDREPFVARHRLAGGAAQALILVPLDEAGGRIAAFDVDLAAMAPFLARPLERPLLPGVVGDGHIDNGVMHVAFLDPGGGRRLEAGPGPWPEWEVDVPLGEFYRAVFAGSHVRVSIDPAVARRLLPGGLPPSPLPWLAALLAGALALGGLALLLGRRERAFVRRREDFVASVSHELRTPLAQIELFTETVLLGRCRSREEERRFLEGTLRESRRLGHLCENILDITRLGRGVLELRPEPRRLAPIVARVTRAFEPLAATRRVRLDARLDPEAGASVDEDGLTRVLVNLLDNAVKYGPAAGEVRVSLRRADAGVELAVEDQGPGVPARERDAIFRPFHRLDRERRSAATGAGLGLAIVRELTARHGGSCRVEDGRDGGARFVVSLPSVAVAP